MTYTEVDALTLADVSDGDLFDALMVLIHDDNYKDKSLGDIRDAIKTSVFSDGVEQINLQRIGSFNKKPSTESEHLGSGQFNVESQSGTNIQVDISTIDADGNNVSSQIAGWLVGDKIVFKDKNSIILTSTPDLTADDGGVTLTTSYYRIEGTLTERYNAIGWTEQNGIIYKTSSSTALGKNLPNPGRFLCLFLKSNNDIETGWELMVQSENRDPITQDDTGIPRLFFNSRLGKLFFINSKPDSTDTTFDLIATRAGVRNFIEIGYYSIFTGTGTVEQGEGIFSTTSIQIHNEDLERFEVDWKLKGINKNDALIIQSGQTGDIINIFFVDRVATNNDVTTYTGTWRTAYNSNQFTEANYFIEFVNRPVEPTTLWPSTSTRIVTTSATATYTLNTGEQFSDWDFIHVIHDNHGATLTTGQEDQVMCVSFPSSLFVADKGLQIYVSTNWKQIKIISDTTFRIDDGTTSALGIKEIVGYKL